MFQKKKVFKTEVLAGFTTFLTMSYIMFVNPQILSSAGMNKSALIAVTCIVTALVTIMVGLFAKSPIAMAPGMGLNAFFTYSLVLGDNISWQTALGAVFLSGLFFLLLTLIGFRKKLTEAIPSQLIHAIAVGIGLFITFIGLVNMGVIVKNDATIVGLGTFTPTLLIGFVGLLVSLILESRKIKGSLLIGILSSTVLAILFGYVKMPSSFISYHIDVSPLFFQLDILGALKWGLFGSIFSLLFMDLFDSIGTIVACKDKLGEIDKRGHIRGLNTLLGLDAIATMIGALFGTSTTTAYIESASGIEEGGKTGITSITVGILFLLSIFLLPLISIVPAYATAPALIMVGLFMMVEITKINFKDLEIAFPSFIIIVMIALSYSISVGLAMGFVSYTLLKIFNFKIKEINPIMWIITLASILFFMI